MSRATAVPTVIASAKSWIEGEAVRQLEQTAKWPGVRLAVGLPDLHPGKGNPVGAAFAVEGFVYPTLVGSDIGCGMAFHATDLLVRKAKRNRWVQKLDGLEGPWNGDAGDWLSSRGVAPTPFDAALGTIGGGNHFAELQAFDEVRAPETVTRLGLAPDHLVLLVHSGSRGLGESILRAHASEHGASGLEVGTPAAGAYLAAHDHAVAWARASRALIAHRFLSALGAEGREILDACHNSAVPIALDGRPCLLHRKGAAPSDQGAIVIPGSRGALSYLVQPTGDPQTSAWSLAHGAGRKWRRSDARARLSGRYSPADLTHTALGSRVICEDKDLLYEEAPQAYKDIDSVVADLLTAGLVEVLATLRPLITYKTRG